MTRRIHAAGALSFLALIACGAGSPAATPIAAVSPMAIGSGLSTVDVCKAIPREDVEAVMGRTLAAAPKAFEYYDAAGTSGCWYEGEKDKDGEAHFGYVVLTPIEAYDHQPLYLKADVAGIGESAYFNNGADARQLWVKVNQQVGFVVAFGDVPREEGAKALAKLVVAAIR